MQIETELGSSWIYREGSKEVYRHNAGDYTSGNTYSAAGMVNVAESGPPVYRHFTLLLSGQTGLLPELCDLGDYTITAVITIEPKVEE